MAKKKKETRKEQLLRYEQISAEYIRSEKGKQDYKILTEKIAKKVVKIHDIYVAYKKNDEPHYRIKDRRFS